MLSKKDEAIKEKNDILDKKSDVIAEQETLNLPATDDNKKKTGRKPFAKNIPLLNKLKKWLETNKPRTAKDSLTGIAMTYLHNQWEKLNAYCIDGYLRISNILAENAIRPFAIGRRAWLFSDTPAGADASGVHNSQTAWP
ncbi:MAG: hypothetical protein COB83_13350 [Gammaproteobacteria bacterium]|nr:MAG: hypothetical protein COB83_13350 [Gammaproteobacteria bacterium]